MAGLGYLRNVVTLSFDQEKCVGCGMCTTVCPHQVFALDNGKAAIRDRDACMECGACSMNCPAEAIQVRKGVGCAAAVIGTALGRKKSACSCFIDAASPKTSDPREGGGTCPAETN